METKISPWGNGQAIRISKEVMELANLELHDRLSIAIQNDGILLKKISKTKAEMFDECFSDFTGEWKTEEISTGAAIGKEVIL